jgi:alpha-N-acetylgalactosaminidase
MGAALESSGRDIVYSCSWPAYIHGGNESLQPFGTFIMDGCNLWRNYDDIQCNWGSLADIIDHWGMCVGAQAEHNRVGVCVGLRVCVRTR